MEQETPPYHGADDRGQPVRRVPEHMLRLCREFRQEATSAEDMLWECLRGRRLQGLKFRRQHPIGRYIADFYCHQGRLVVEVEGAIHNRPEQAEYDAHRFQMLEAQGFTVLRFRNEEVLNDIEGVLDRILAALFPSPPYPPLSQWERGAGG
ncbi:MAG: endonuclease domain-containing protein [Chloroflexia bacterium]